MEHFAAVLIGFLGCFFDSLALALWRLTSTPLYNTTRVVILGYVFLATSLLLDLASLGSLTESTHSVVDAFSMVSMLLVSQWLLGEEPTGIDIFGALCVVVGIGICVFSRPQEEQEAGNALRDYVNVVTIYRASSTVGWFSIIAGMVCVAIVIGKLSTESRVFAVAAGCTGTLGETLAKGMTTAAQAGFLVDAAVFLGIICIYLFIELRIIRMSLAQVPLYVHQPAFFASWALGGIVSGGVVYDDFSVYRNRGVNIALTVFGIGLMLFGCILPASLRLRKTQTSVSTSRVSGFLKRLALPPNEAYEMEVFTRTM